MEERARLVAEEVGFQETVYSDSSARLSTTVDTYISVLKEQSAKARSVSRLRHKESKVQVQRERVKPAPAKSSVWAVDAGRRYRSSSGMKGLWRANSCWRRRARAWAGKWTR